MLSRGELAGAVAVSAAKGGRTELLQLRPNCEYCDKDLPPQAADACICSYECTFCSDCACGTLRNVCPNCGGGFVPRPIRPSLEHRPGLSRSRQPPSADRVHLKWDRKALAAFIAGVACIPPLDR